MIKLGGKQASSAGSAKIADEKQLISGEKQWKHKRKAPSESPAKIGEASGCSVAAVST